MHEAYLDSEAKSETHPIDDIIDIKNFAYEQCKKLYPVDLKHAFYFRIIQAYNEYCEEVEELASED